MSKRMWWWAVLTVSSIVCVAGFTRVEAAAGQSMGLNVSEMKFATLPGLPTCATGAVESGDPTIGPSIILLKTAAGCSFPWHWHTPNERVMMVTGVGHAEMKDGKPVALRPGGFAMMPSHHVHRFRCDGQCTLYVDSDAAFDIHYVDGTGNEISPDVALKAVRETAATEMK